MRMTWRLAEKIYNYRYKEGTTTRWVGENIIQLRPTPLGRQPTNKRIITIAEVLPKDPEVQNPHQAPWTGSPALGRRAPQCLALKASKAYFQESQRAVGNRDSTLKRHTKNLICSKTQGRSRNLKEAWVRPTCWSWRASQRGRKQLGLTLETQTLAGDILGSSSYHKDTGTGKHHF